MIRPAVANVDQALVIFAAAKPKPNFNLLDRFLILMQYQQVPAVVCFNKQDLAAEQELEVLKDTYISAGYEVRFTSAATREGVEEIRSLLKGRTTTVAGPSGVGKSSLINLLSPEASMETGDISRKIERGRHTTRHSELFALDEDSYICDTPDLAPFTCRKAWRRRSWDGISRSSGNTRRAAGSRAAPISTSRTVR